MCCVCALLFAQFSNCKQSWWATKARLTFRLGFAWASKKEEGCGRGEHLICNCRQRSAYICTLLFKYICALDNYCCGIYWALLLLLVVVALWPTFLPIYVAQLRDSQRVKKLRSNLYLVSPLCNKIKTVNIHMLRVIKKYIYF